MDFMILAVLSAFFFSLSIIVDKYILSNKMRDGFSYFYLWNIVSAPLYTVVLVVSGAFVFPSEFTGLILFSVLGFANVAIIYYILKTAEVSTVSPLLSSGTMFTVIFSVIFLSEWYGLLFIAFVLIIILGAVLTTIDERTSIRKIFSFNKAFWLIMLANILGAIFVIIVNLFLQGMDGFNILAWRQIIWLPLSLLLFPFMLNKKRITIIKSNWKHALPYTILSVSILFMAISLSYIAFQQSVQITSAMLASGGISTVILSFVISRIKPSIINERHKKGVYLIRAAGAIIIFIGVAGIFLTK